ncbi:hypothetical protein VTK56DRAFT_1720 [Thermocarpiscus australiensis]
METTIIPVQTLPSCVSHCGVLYDVNGACVPPAAPTAAASAYDSCFCNDPRLAPFKTGTAGVCDAACTANPPDLGTIQSWFTSFCANIAQNGNAAPTATASSRPAAAANSGGGSGTWLDNHWRWVIFLVIMVVAIVGIWVGACIWRRHYLRKKDRQYALGAGLARGTGSGRVVPNNTESTGSIHPPQPGMFNPAPISAARVYDEKPPKAKKKWNVMDRS